MLHKTGKEEGDPANYRPIALLNGDHKIITKVLATRLKKKNISPIIHPNQTGFVPGRWSFNNIRLLLNTMYSSYGKEAKIAMLSLDTQKVFDQIEWFYIFETLKRGIFHGLD